MRKDVKFGLTIGAILVVTLVIYVIVLSRGPAVPQKLGIVMPGPSDQTPDANASASPGQKDVATAGVADEQDNGPAAADSNPAAAPPSEVTPAAPATQPASGSASSDWDNALNHGLPPTASAPQRTVTPSIDSPSSSIVRAGVIPTPRTPLIDPLPTTQPTSLLMSTLPVRDPAPPEVISPPTSTPPSTPAASTPRTHRVASGESVYSISETVYGSGKYYKRILAANPGINPRHLKIGQILVIPELTEADKPAAPAAGNASAVDSASAYTVVSGDSLQSISRKLYGTTAMSDKLYEANKALIGPDENVLKIGWVLKLPKPPTAGGNQ